MVTAGILDRLKRFEVFLTPAGTDELTGAVQAYRKQYGEEWLTKFRDANPDLCILVDLAANYEFEAAWSELQRMVDEWIDGEPGTMKRIGLHAAKGVFLNGAKPDIERVHAALRAEIDRPRF
jgi:hypothetical protein